MSILRISATGSSQNSSQVRRRRGAFEDPTVDLTGMSVGDILASLVAIKRANSYTRLENDYIIRYLEANDPELLCGITQVKTTAAAAAAVAPDAAAAPDDHTTKTIQFTSDTVVEHAPVARASGESTASDAHHGGGLLLSARRRSAEASLGEPYNADRRSQMSTDDMSMAGSTWRSQTSNQNQEVNYPMKLELVHKDRKTFEAAIVQLREATKHELRQYTAQVEEMRLSRIEAEETLAEFQDFVIVKGMPPGQTSGASVPLERFIKFIDKWVIHGNGLVEQMRLRNTTMEQEARALEKSLVIKAELSSILLPVDFQQREIDRRSLQAAFEEKEANLKGLKRVAGNVALVLATQRKLVDESKTQLADLRKRIADAKQSARSFERARDTVEDSIEDWTGRLERLKERRKQWSAPSTSDYLKVVVRLEAVEREAVSLRRSVKIAKAKQEMMEMKLRKRRRDEREARLRDARVREAAAHMVG